jgi:dienelactone hydrolase
MPRTAFVLTVVLVAASKADAAVQTNEVEYTHDGQKFKGFFAWDDAVQGKRPGVLVVHEWWGLNDYARKRARMLAELGYVAFAADMYGDGKTTKHPQEAGQWAGQVRMNQEAWRARGLAGLNILKGHELVDTSRLAAIGYCFGGSTVLQLAFSGADLDGVVSFHGALTPPEADVKSLKTKILVCHGAADSFIPDDAVIKFRTGLDQAGADYQIVYYGGARHSFTNPDADAAGVEGLKYNKAADERSWAAMQRFFDEVFGKTK